MNEVNNIVRFIKGKKGTIGYNENGKIILSRKNVSIGYYKLSNIIEKEKVILADTERIPYDIFPTITYNEFLNVLKYNGFSIGFIEDFCYTCGDYTSNEHLIFAYDIETHIIIVAETWAGEKSFNTIDIYCPGMSIFHINPALKLPFCGNASMTIFRINDNDIWNKNLGIIHLMKNNMRYIVENQKNIYKDTISLWNYSEKLESLKDFEESRKKIKQANRKDMIELFKDSKLMMKALNS